jgi:hypothetical protein
MKKAWRLFIKKPELHVVSATGSATVYKIVPQTDT